MRKLPKGYDSWEAVYDRVKTENPSFEKRGEFFLNDEYFTVEELFAELGREFAAVKNNRLQFESLLIPNDSAELIILAVEKSQLASDTKDNLKRVIEPLTRKQK